MARPATKYSAVIPGWEANAVSWLLIIHIASNQSTLREANVFVVVNAMSSMLMNASTRNAAAMEMIILLRGKIQKVSAQKASGIRIKTQSRSARNRETFSQKKSIGGVRRPAAMSKNALQLIIAAIFSPRTQAADASNGKRIIPSLFVLSQSAIVYISIRLRRPVNRQQLFQQGLQQFQIQGIGAVGFGVGRVVVDF